MLDKITIKNQVGSKRDADFISAFSFLDNDKKYLMYSIGRKDEDGKVELILSEINDDVLSKVTPEEWPKVRNAMSEIAGQALSTIKFIDANKEYSVGDANQFGKSIYASEENANLLKTNSLAKIINDNPIALDSIAKAELASKVVAPEPIIKEEPVVNIESTLTVEPSAPIVDPSENIFDTVSPVVPNIPVQPVAEQPSTTFEPVPEEIKNVDTPNIDGTELNLDDFSAPDNNINEAEPNFSGVDDGIIEEAFKNCKATIMARLNAKEQELNRREQELNEKEKNLNAKEQMLINRYDTIVSVEQSKKIA